MWQSRNASLGSFLTSSVEASWTSMWCSAYRSHLKVMGDGHIVLVTTNPLQGGEPARSLYIANIQLAQVEADARKRKSRPQPAAHHNHLVSQSGAMAALTVPQASRLKPLPVTCGRQVQQSFKPRDSRNRSFIGTLLHWRLRP